MLSEERAVCLEAMIFKNQIFRWKIKRLIHKWRLSRLKIINTEDILTGETPLKPVYIYDWAERSKYVLEAGTVYRDICERLFKSDSLFNNSLAPRNMFTNKILTFGQMHFITDALRLYGYTNWALQGFKSCNFAINFFKRVYKQPIYYEVLKRCFANCTSTECIDLLIDFIEVEHEYHGIVCVNTIILLWYIQNHPNCVVVEAWRKLCFKFYKHAYMNNEINYTDIVHVVSRDLLKTPLSFMNQKYREAHPSMLSVIIYTPHSPIDSSDDDL